MGLNYFKLLTMKKTYSFPIFLVIIFLFACTKAEDFYDELGKGSYLTLVQTNSSLLNAVDPASSVSQVVSAYGEPVASINVYASASATLDQTQWKLVKNIPFSEQTTITVTNAELATVLGLTPGALEPGTVFHLYNEAVLQDGRKFSSANTSDVDLENQPPFNVAFHSTATVVCPYDPATIAGTYEVIKDDWQDWGPGDLVEVTAGPGANEINLSQVWPNPAFGDIVTPLTITVDPASGTVTVPVGVTFGNYGGFLAITDPGSTGFVFSCTNQISVRVNIKTQGFFQLILQK
jgi:hypothetical protein